MATRPKKGSRAAKDWGRRMAALRKRRKTGAARPKKRRASARPTSNPSPRKTMAKKNTKRRTRRAVTKAAARVRRTYRRRGGADFIGMTVQGVQDGIVLVGTKALTRGVAAGLQLDGNSVLGAAVEGLSGTLLAILTNQFSPGTARLVMAQAVAGPMERMVRQMNVPVVSPLLGEDPLLEMGDLEGAYDLGEWEADELGGTELAGYVQSGTAGVYGLGDHAEAWIG